MKIYSNAKDYKLSEAQARDFAMQIYEPMKKYIAEHKAEYEKWINQEENNNE